MNSYTLYGFFSELEKQAGWLSSGSKNPSAWETVGRSALKGLGYVAGALGLELVAEGGVEWWKGRQHEKAKDPIFQKVIKLHPDLKEYPFDKVMMYWDHLYKFAPSLAADPLAAGAYLKQSLDSFDSIGGPPHDTVKNLVQIEGSIEDTKRSRKPGLGTLETVSNLKGSSGGNKFQFGGNKTIHTI